MKRTIEVDTSRTGALLDKDVVVSTRIGTTLVTVEREYPDPVYTPGTHGTASVDRGSGVAVHGQHGTWVQWGDDGLKFILDKPLYGSVNMADPSVVWDFQEDPPGVTEKALAEALDWTEAERNQTMTWSEDARIVLNYIRDNS